MKLVYKGYIIEGNEETSFDITETNGDLVDGCFKNIEEAMEYIDRIEEE